MIRNLLFFFLCWASMLSGQHTIKGVVEDGQTPLYGATVLLLHPKDSTMKYFGLTNEDGAFEIYQVAEGHYVIQISYTGYNNLFFDVKTANDMVVDVGTKRLSVSNEILKEVKVVADRIPMGLHGDTIVYNADAFKTGKGASVEDLLKKLPGVEVARDGKIKAQGKRVKKVLVDGKKFFDGDPTIATKNLEAEAVKKVEVFDKKSDEAEFTGVDDGKEEKTINLKLKDGYKNGGFGKVLAEGGPDYRYNAKANYNRFSPKLTASLISNINNVNKQTLSFNEYLSFAGGLGNLLVGGGDFPGFSPNEGQSLRKAAGTNFNYNPSGKTEMTINYMFGQNNKEVERKMTAGIFSDDVLFETKGEQSELDNVSNHSFRIFAKHDIGAGKRLTTRIHGLGNTQDYFSESTTDYLQKDSLTNKTEGNLSSVNIHLRGSAKVAYEQVFKKKGRYWRGAINYQRKRERESADLNFTNGLSPYDSILLQHQVGSANQNVWNVEATYNEPLGHGYYLYSKYGFADEMEVPERNFYDILNGNAQRNDMLSGRFHRDWRVHQVSIGMKRNRKRLQVDGQCTIQRVYLSIEDRGKPKKSNPEYVVLPYLHIKKKFRHNRTFDLIYHPVLNSPTLIQLVTIPNNFNPNIIRYGNSALHSEYNHHLNLAYFALNSFDFSHLTANLELTYSSNKIVESSRVLDDLSSESHPVNSPEYYGMKTYISHSNLIRPLNMKYNLSVSSGMSRYRTYINTVESVITSSNNIIDLSVENKNKSRIDVAAGLRYNIGFYKSSLQSAQNQVYTDYSIYTDGVIDINDATQLTYKYDLRTFRKSKVGGSHVIHLLNASISFAIPKSKLVLKLSVHDLLNQEMGILRSGDVNRFSETRSIVLGRYILFGGSYKIGKVKREGL